MVYLAWPILDGVISLVIICSFLDCDRILPGIGLVHQSIPCRFSFPPSFSFLPENRDKPALCYLSEITKDAPVVTSSSSLSNLNSRLSRCGDLNSRRVSGCFHCLLILDFNFINFFEILSGIRIILAKKTKQELNLPSLYHLHRFLIMIPYCGPIPLVLPLFSSE